MIEPFRPLEPHEWPPVPLGVEVIETVETPDGLRQVVLECPFCGREHVHGQGFGVVLAHCHGGLGTAYYLAPRSRLSPDEYRLWCRK